MGVEPKVVTEFSEDLVFKKPKLMGKFGSSSLEWGENLTYKPNFSKRGTVYDNRTIFLVSLFSFWFEDC